MLLGCIGDDFTGSSDIANTLSKGGMKVTQYTGIPNEPALPDVEAGVVSLKSRTIPVDEAISQSLDAAKWLLDQGCEQIFFKYCSTFDSTPEGNIGPVAEALAKYLKEDQVIFCPAFPATGRSIYQGHLFVNDTLKHIAHSLVKEGSEIVQNHMRNSAPAFYIADAIEDNDLTVLGSAAKDRKLLTGGSGLALGLPQNFRDAGKINQVKSEWQKIDGKSVILSGSCSIATRGQVAKFKQTNPSFEITAEDVFSQEVTAMGICDWIESQEKTPLVYSSADPKIVKAAQEKFGTDIIAEKIEGVMGAIATEMVKRGATCIICAGGETSGAIVTALKVSAMEIGPEIAPGVPALKDVDRDLVLALKSGNFGGEEFFQDALKVLSN